MRIYKSDRVRFISGLILIIIFYSTYYIYVEENEHIKTLSRFLEYFIKFLFTVAIYLIGYYHLGKLKDEWMSYLWHFIHISGLCIISAIGLYDYLIADISLGTLLFAGSVQEFLISPVLYVGMGLLNRSLNNRDK
ncbi:hypothetical protein [Seonamhaeicola sp. ML3]|uniref:hypothetical protein n=1 Tax=Seonamhaeicola sp. ML3 TaxID=2937786 RepID=UPI00200C4118|nr:hypothetical protein [Seonamhaeicola sp. ML3]